MADNIGIVNDFDLFWAYKIIPVEQHENTIVLILHQDSIYRETCSRLAAEVNYSTRRIEIYAVTDEADPLGGDNLFSITIHPAEWSYIEARIGTFEANKARVDELRMAALEGSKIKNPMFSEKGIENKIRGFLGGSRKSRKNSKKKKQTRRRKV